MDSYDVLRRPVITEKSTMLGGNSQYVFEVARDANKIEIKRAVEEVFKVRVRAVNVLHMRGKMRRMGRTQGMTSPWKKAVVSLESGQRIEFFQGV
ncbi:MAG TPA: 50S ribosomal protein L23 [Chloroflexota bacterium]|nr:50S ribosomal protein L23 [Chloroflexota bacterium]